MASSSPDFVCSPWSFSPNPRIRNQPASIAGFLPRAAGEIGLARMNNANQALSRASSIERIPRSITSYNRAELVGCVEEYAELWHEPINGDATYRQRINTDERCCDTSGRYRRSSQSYSVLFTGSLAVRAANAIRKGDTVKVVGFWGSRLRLNRDTAEQESIRELFAKSFEVLSRGGGFRRKGEAKN